MLVEGGTDSEPSIAKLENDGNISRQLYSAIGHETLQSDDSPVCQEIIENAKQSMPYHDNQSQFLRKHVSD